MVGKIEVIYTSSVISYLNDLVVILYKKQYFGFIESADEYVDEIYDAILERIKKSPHKKTPKPLKYLGSNYVFYKVNTRATWYVFFERRDQKFLITELLIIIVLKQKNYKAKNPHKQSLFMRIFY